MMGHRPSTGAWILSSHLPALLLFVVITLVMTLPYPLQIRTSLYNWSDALLNTWALAWGTHALLTDPLNLYNANIFYPYANTLAYSESLIPQTLLAAPVILSTNLPAFAHNLLALLSFVLAAFGMYLLAFDLTRSRAAGLVAGMIYTFTSYKMMHFAHLQLLSSQWLPFALLYLRRLSGDGVTGRAGLKSGFLFALFFVLQALSSFYYAFFAALAAALYVLYVVARRLAARVRPLPVGALRPLLFSMLLIAVVGLPLALPYFSVQRELGLERGTRDVEYYAATLRTYFSVPDGNWLYARWLAPVERMTGSGERDFVGFAALALALLGLITRPRRAAEKWFYVLLALAGLILSFGARNEILLFPGWPKITLPFYLPFRYLFEWVPGFKALRGPDRFAYLAVLGLAVLAAYGTRAAVIRLRAFSPNLAYAAPLLLVALIGIENLAIPIRATNPTTLARPLPDWAQFVAAQQPDAVVLEIPMIYNRESLAWPQYYSVFHWRKLVNGLSGFFPPGYAALAELTLQFPDDTVLGVLDELGVRLVVVHNSLLTQEQRAAIRSRLAGFDGRVQRVLHSGADDVYRLGGEESAWGNALAQSIPAGARVWLNNTREDRRLYFEFAAEFLRGRELRGDSRAAFRSLVPPDAARPADYVIVNTNDLPPEDFSYRVWQNDYLTVYAHSGPPAAQR